MIASSKPGKTGLRSCLSFCAVSCHRRISKSELCRYQWVETHGYNHAVATRRRSILCKNLTGNDKGSHHDGNAIWI